MMMGSKASIIFMIFLIIPTGPCWASAEIGDADALIELLTMSRLSTMTAQSIVQQGIENHHLNVSPELRQSLEHDVTRVVNVRLRAAGGYLEQARGVYLRQFSPQELAEALKFFSSPTGRKFIDKERYLAEQTSSNSGDWVNVLLRDIDSEFISILKKYGIPPK